MDRQLLGGRLWWVFMVGASIANFTCSLWVKGDLPVSDGLSDIDEEDENEMEMEMELELEVDKKRNIAIAKTI
jgi:hypothetical protein